MVRDDPSDGTSRVLGGRSTGVSRYRAAHFSTAANGECAAHVRLACRIAEPDLVWPAAQTSQQVDKRQVEQRRRSCRQRPRRIERLHDASSPVRRDESHGVDAVEPSVRLDRRRQPTGQQRFQALMIMKLVRTEHALQRFGVRTEPGRLPNT